MASPYAVCICTNRPARAVAPTLDAIVKQAGSDRVLSVLSGLDDASVATHEAAVGPAVTVLAEPRPGLSNARNRALAECADDDVIAFVDDDAIVDENWFDEMRTAWERAEPDVACIGGPIRPRFANGQRPDWLSDRLLPVLTTLDYGPEAKDLDPTKTTLYGANVSFRAGPLRDVGGFDPGLGHGGRPTGFGEEDEAERALARAGYRIRYEPGPFVWHVIPPERTTPPAFLKRRFEYGVGLGARNGRAPKHALKQLTSSAAGAPVAAAQRQPALAMERATRVAENAGVLLAPLLARR